MNIRRLLPLLFLVAAAACNNDEEPWPSLITEMADILTDEEGTLCQLHTDSEVNYQLTNPVAGYAPSVAYRILADYNTGELEMSYGIYESIASLSTPPRVVVPDSGAVSAAWKTYEAATSTTSAKPSCFMASRNRSGVSLGPN